MKTEDLIAAACPKIGAIGAIFYFHPDTQARGKARGLEGMPLYVLGRGGVLGDVEPVVVSSAFGFWNPALVATHWTAARAVMAPREGARFCAECCQELGRSRLAELPGLDTFCAAAGAVVDAAEPAGLALFAGTAGEPRAADAPALALQLINVLREYRGSAHLVAVLASGLSPRVAHFLRRPRGYAMFGWTDDGPTVTDEDRAKLAAADALTDRLVAPAYSVLGDRGGEALVEGLDAIGGALKG